MIALLTEQDLPLLLDLQQTMLAESGLGVNRALAWRKRSAGFYLRTYREGTCVHAGWRAGSHLVALAGAVIVQDSLFLGVQARTRGMIVDEYVLPEYRGRGIGDRLNDCLLHWLAARNASLAPGLSPNAARLACSATLGVRL